MLLQEVDVELLALGEYFQHPRPLLQLAVFVQQRRHLRCQLLNFLLQPGRTVPNVEKQF